MSDLHDSTRTRAWRRAATAAALVFALFAVFAVALASGCGRTVDSETPDGGASGADGAAAAAPTSGVPSSDFDGGSSPSVDGATGPIDAGAPPVVTCTDAGAMCASPPSDCLDEHTMRYFSGGTCNDAGTCDFAIITMKCDPSPVPPDCYQGGCRVVIVR